MWGRRSETMRFPLIVKRTSSRDWTPSDRYSSRLRGATSSFFFFPPQLPAALGGASEEEKVVVLMTRNQLDALQEERNTTSTLLDYAPTAIAYKRNTVHSENLNSATLVRHTGRESSGDEEEMLY